MNPRLVGIAGSLKGKVFPLPEQEFSIGREVTNRLSIVHPTVSGRHCVITRGAGQFKISDLNSRSGTFVNGLPVKERGLAHGDQIRLGHCVFVILFDEAEPTAVPNVVLLDEGALVSQTRIELRSEETDQGVPEDPAGSVPTTERTLRELSALLKISTALSSLRGLEALQEKLLESIFEIVPADRGAIILLEENSEEFAAILGRERSSGLMQPFHVRRAAIDHVLRERVAVLRNDLQPSESPDVAEGQPPRPMGSLLAVPLFVFGRMAGIIYLEATNPKVHFDESHLELLTAVGGIAALALEKVRHMEWLEKENRRLHAELDIEHDLIGESACMQEVYRFISRVASTHATILIRGESGTGKELVAGAIHRNSARADKPFVAINCAALTETLLESEMFGHERGAFTGAVAQKRGKLEVADGGTVLLDEVGELAPSLQAKLLRVLQERQFERVGGTRPVKVDIRLIAATNKDLEEAVRNKTFRQDLYYRLNVISLQMPPLREHPEDIPLLASYFATRYSEKAKRPVMGISAEARACLVNYDWPGNVRELENAIERGVVLGSGDLILPENLPETVLEAESPQGIPIPRYHEAVRRAKKQLIRKALELAEGSYTEAAKALGVHPNYLHRLVRNMNLREEIKK
jgi:Nif-specific regulatory protein